MARGIRQGDPLSSFLFLIAVKDDTVVFREWSQRNGRNLMGFLKCFEKASGLKLKLSKSSLYGVGVPQQEVNAMASFLSWNPIVEKFKEKLSFWKARTLSFGGRLTLVLSVLGSLSLFCAPASVIQKLERVRKNFFWGGGGDCRKLAWVKWEKVISKFELRGLNIGSLKASNLGLLGKWWWRFKVERNSL
ncbi:hypothetical protein Tco_0037133 [Tanacetum coccineum]